jgi:hypothetical protein
MPSAATDPAFEADIASLTAARDQAERRAYEAQQRADHAEQRAEKAEERAERSEARTDELREKLDKLLHDQKAAEAVAVEALMKSEDQRRAWQAKGRLRRAWDGWRGR